jgi:ketosteroid isomerase-like protein
MSNVETVKKIYDAFGRGDVETVFTLCSPEIVIEADAAMPWGGRYEGHEGLQAFYGKVMGAVDLQIEPEIIFAAGDQVIERGRAKGTVRASGVPFDVAEVHVWTVRDGLVTRNEPYFDSPAMLDSLGQPAAAG